MPERSTERAKGGESLFGNERTADLSGCGRYRYRLGRAWGPGQRVAFVMLNPSTADAYADDSTIKKCMGFARRWGFDGIDVVNLYAWRATDPAEIPRDFAVGEGGGVANTPNDNAIFEAAQAAGRIIAAWGATSAPHKSLRVQIVTEILQEAGEVEALRLTKHGHPWHPLYAPYTVEPVTLAEARYVA